MPTGYTAVLLEHEVTFPQFAISCARAFGALITMRDEPGDAPIPEELVPSDFHAMRLEEAREELRLFSTLTVPEREVMAKAGIATEIKRIESWISRETAENSVFDKMAEQVRRWIPPTSDHERMKEFMLEQLSISRSDLSYNYGALAAAKALSTSEWLTAKEKSLQRDVEYHAEEDQKERQRTAERNAWLRALRLSLTV
jgi:hypothetical protein